MTVQYLLLTNCMHYFDWTEVVNWILTNNSFFLCFLVIYAWLSSAISISNLMWHFKQVAVCIFVYFVFFRSISNGFIFPVIYNLRQMPKPARFQVKWKVCLSPGNYFLKCFQIFFNHPSVSGLLLHIKHIILLFHIIWIKLETWHPIWKTNVFYTSL